MKTLIEKLKQQADSGLPISTMLSTLQMLEAELTSLNKNTSSGKGEKVVVIMPVTHTVFSEDAKTISDNKEEKIIEVLQVDEKEIENELAEIKRHANNMYTLGQIPGQKDEFNPLEDVPTLAHQDIATPSQKAYQVKIEYPDLNVVEEKSLNDKLKQNRVELSESLTSTPIKDLRKAIGVNDRYLFISELFRGDESMYERSIKTIQGFSIFAEAEFWIRRELKLKLGWNAKDPHVKQFDELVRRRFL